MKDLRARITEVDYPAPGHALLRFAAAEPIAGAPGEFVMLRGDWGVHPALPRAFSLVESGAAGAVLVKAIGPGTERLAAMAAGDALAVLGPLGRGFQIKEGAPKALLVAGGVGVAPLLFLARELRAADKGKSQGRGGRKGAPCRFLYGGRGKDDLPLAADIAAVADLETSTEDGSVGERGRVTDLLERILRADPEWTIYTCGPEPMLRAVAAMAFRYRAPCQAALEAPMACGLGTCKGCAVPVAGARTADDEEIAYRYVCCDGPVFDAAEVFAEDAND